MTDPIADMLTRIRNAQMVKKTEVVMPYSKLKLNILSLLKEEGWIEYVEKIEPVPASQTKQKVKLNDALSRFASLKVKIKYNGNQAKIEKLQRVSKPGRRVYVNKGEVPQVLNGRGLAIISTSQGLLTDREARERKVGGEVICEIY